jgi:3-hydroxymyristoyl/3-hydroxydecanoyl-(acyl carrier protein) dehydratase
VSALLEFDGEPFDPLASTVPTAAVVPAPTAAVVPAPTAGAEPAATLARLRRRLVAAHASALTAQTALARRLLDGPHLTSTSTTGSSVPREATNGSFVPDGTTPGVATLPAPPSREAAFKPPARTDRRELDRPALDALALGDLAGVFGPRYDQHGTNPEVHTHGGHLDAVAGLDVRGGGAGRGGLRAVPAPGATLREAAVEAVEVLVIALGLPLVLAGTTLESTTDAPDTPARELAVDAVEVDLIPRPHVVARVTAADGAAVEVTVTVRELPGVTVGPDATGRLVHPGRVCSQGELAVLGEFHFTHMSHGDPGIAHGPQFAHLADRKATRLPSHGLQLVDRVVSIDGERGAFTDATYVTEYDAPADSWYFADTANADAPNVVLMETSLQSALLVGYHLGATLSDPGQDYVLRNLGGTATLRSDLDLRDRTIRQHSRITATTPTSGSILQEFTYSLTVDGEPYYDGESMFGFFTAATMANQTGLDGGRSVPSWLDREQPVGRRTIDVAARRARGEPGRPGPARDHLAMLDTVTVVDRGGEHGQGYLHISQPVDPGAWYFARHFHLDPVIPGSLGVEQVLQAMQEWALDTGLADELDDPEFVVPVGAPLSWRYRGQVVPTDGVVTIEVHLTGVERRPGRVRVGGHASLWKPGLRIYEVQGATVELRERGAPAW